MGRDRVLVHCASNIGGLPGVGGSLGQLLRLCLLQIFLNVLLALYQLVLIIGKFRRAIDETILSFLQNVRFLHDPVLSILKINRLLRDLILSTLQIDCFLCDFILFGFQLLRNHINIALFLPQIDCHLG